MIGQVQLVATGDSTTFAAASWFYQALGIESTDTLIFNEANNPRYSLRAFPSTFMFSNVVAANIALSGWTIADLETQASIRDALLRADYTATAGRPPRLNVLAVRYLPDERRGSALPDDAYAHDGQITKQMIRAVTLASALSRLSVLLMICAICR